MLILSRRTNEKIIIGANAEIIITILEDKFHRHQHPIRIGIEADENIPINRAEIYYRLKAEEKYADKN